MTFKYLYCIQILSEGMVKWLEEKEFEKVKCPIDSYIARSIFKISPMTKDGEQTRKIAWHIATSTKLDGKSCCWSKISEEQYRILEEAIRNFCDTQRVGSRSMIPLEFDLLFWEAL